jgi:hypothetical protein
MNKKNPTANGEGLEKVSGNFLAPFIRTGHREQRFDSRDTDPTVTFCNKRAAALALLSSSTKLTRKAGAFLGQMVVDSSPMSMAQSAWLTNLLKQNGLPPLSDGGAP